MAVRGVDVLGAGRRGIGPSSWVMVGILVPVLLISSDVTTARGYATINWAGSVSTLGGGAGSWIGVKIVVFTLGAGRASAVSASVNKVAALLGVLLSATLGDAWASTAFIDTCVLFVAAFVKICPRRSRACTSSSVMPAVLWVRRVAVIRLAAAMMASAGVSVGFDMYLCLKKTVPDTLVDFVFRFHRFQHL